MAEALNYFTDASDQCALSHVGLCCIKEAFIEEYAEEALSPLSEAALAEQEAMKKVCEMAAHIEDILEVPQRLGDHSRHVIQLAIENFRESLEALERAREKLREAEKSA